MAANVDVEYAGTRAEAMDRAENVSPTSGLTVYRATRRRFGSTPGSSGTGITGHGRLVRQLTGISPCRRPYRRFANRRPRRWDHPRTVTDVHPNGWHGQRASIPGARLETIIGIGPRYQSGVGPDHRPDSRARHFALAPTPNSRISMSKSHAGRSAAARSSSRAGSGIGRALAQGFRRNSGLPRRIATSTRRASRRRGLTARTALLRVLDVRCREAQRTSPRGARLGAPPIWRGIKQRRVATAAKRATRFLRTTTGVEHNFHAWSTHPRVLRSSSSQNEGATRQYVERVRPRRYANQSA